VSRLASSRWLHRGTLKRSIAVIGAVVLISLIAMVADLRSDVISLRRSVERQDACVQVLERNVRLGPDEPKLSCAIPVNSGR